MPRKRNNLWSRNKKQKQIITARLIEISLKLDDHVYNHKPITESDAEEYIKEVASYKTLCDQDERTLQVIEKLTRCMKAIINEHEEHSVEICDMNDGSSLPDQHMRESSISPVYSVSDKDRTQFTQILEERGKGVSEASKLDVDIVDLCDIDDDVIRAEINNATKVYSSYGINVEVDVHRAISNLSLREVGDALEITTTESLCSQSILNNFDNIKNIIEHNENLKSKTCNVSNLTVNEDNYSEYNNKENTVAQPVNIIKTKSHVFNQDVAVANQTDETQQNIILCNEICTGDNSSHILKHTIDIKKTQFCNNVKSASITVKRSAYCKVDPLNDFQELQFESRSINSTETESAKLDNTNPLNNVAIISKNSTTAKKKRGPGKNKTEKAKEIKPKNKRDRNKTSKIMNDKILTNSVQKNTDVPIYNTNVENDLSWIENIRYVREIRVDENDPKLNLEESFWDNYDLPANWNDSEFDL